MSNIVQLVFDWSEVWALFIPLFVSLLLRKKQHALLKPVIIYLWLALVLNLSEVIIAEFKITYHFPAWLQSNNPIYNIHSIVRFACFSCFFISLPQPSFKWLKLGVALIFVLYTVVNFTYFDVFFNPKSLSGNLLTAEAFLLLIYCMLYYFYALNGEDDVISKGPSFWIVTGLSIYVVINFFVFLFYVPMITQNMALAAGIWNVHNVAYIILCLFITRALYATIRN
jgi:hypothetical protein